MLFEDILGFNKIIFYGAGPTGRSVFDNFPEKERVIGFVDSSSSLWGSSYRGKIIYQPTKDFLNSGDVIFIASSFDSEIREMLKWEFDSLPPIISCTATEIMGQKFLTAEANDFCAALVVKIFEFMDECRVTCFAYGGTLLGVVRENRILPWDYDIDLAISENDLLRLDLVGLGERVFSGVEDIKWKCNTILWSEERPPSPDNVATISYTISHPIVQDFKVDFFVYKRFREFCDFSHGRGSLYRLKSSYFENFQAIPFHNGEIKIPNQSEQLLTDCFGDWRVVKKNWDFKYGHRLK